MRRMMVAALAVTATMSLARPASAGSMTYISLGDSVAFGETTFQNNPSAGDRGYAKFYDQYLASQNGGTAPKLINLAIDGETSTSFTSASGQVPPTSGISDQMLATWNTHYANTPTESQNIKFLQAVGNQLAQGNTISNITVSLGANDLFTLANSPGFLTLSPAAQQQQLAAALGTFATNYTNLLGEIHALVPDAKVSLLGEYNPFPATPNSPYAPFAAPAIQALNAVIKNLAAQSGSSYVDTYTPFVGNESTLTYITKIPGDVHTQRRGLRRDRRPDRGRARAVHPGHRRRRPRRRRRRQGPPAAGRRLRPDRERGMIAGRRPRMVGPPPAISLAPLDAEGWNPQMNTDLDEPREPTLAVPMPRRYVAAAWLGLSIFVAIGIPSIYNVLAHDPATVRGKHGDLFVTGADRWAWVGTYAVIYFALPIAVGIVIPFCHHLKIDKRGLRAGKLNLAWDKVVGCHWNRYRPGDLEVRTHDARSSVLIDARYRAEVEAALRKLGKWEE